MEPQTDSRRDRRNPVKMTAKCITHSGLKDDGFLSDISAEGCCVTTRGLFYRIGVAVIIRPEGMEGISGTVRWVDGQRAGVQFDRPIYGPVLEHLVAMHAGGESSPVYRQESVSEFAKERIPRRHQPAPMSIGKRP